LLDIIMPGMDGYDVLSILKNSAQTKNIPVIFISGLADIDAEEKGLQLGAADYITKPFTAGIAKLRVRNQLKLSMRFKQQKLMTKIAHNCLTDTHIDTLLADTLRMVGEFMDIAQILLYKYEADGSFLTCRSAWTKPALSLEKHIEMKLQLREPMVSFIHNLQSRAEDVLCLHSAHQHFKEAMMPYRKNFNTYLTAPIFIKRKLHAILDFSTEDEKHEWSESEIDLAVLVSSVLGGVFERDMIADELNVVRKLQSELIAAKEQAEHPNRVKS